MADTKQEEEKQGLWQFLSSFLRPSLLYAVGLTCLFFALIAITTPALLQISNGENIIIDNAIISFSLAFLGFVFCAVAFGINADTNKQANEIQQKEAKKKIAIKQDVEAKLAHLNPDEKLVAKYILEKQLINYEIDRSDFDHRTIDQRRFGQGTKRIAEFNRIKKGIRDLKGQNIIERRNLSTPIGVETFRCPVDNLRIITELHEKKPDIFD